MTATARTSIMRVVIATEDSFIWCEGQQLLFGQYQALMSRIFVCSLFVWSAQPRSLSLS
jgi:hypothetical protein